MKKKMTRYCDYGGVCIVVLVFLQKILRLAKMAEHWQPQATLLLFGVVHCELKVILTIIQTCFSFSMQKLKIFNNK